MEETRMIVKTIASAALAGALVLVPAAGAFAAYPAPGDSLNCSASAVTSGSAFSCTIGGDNGLPATLTVTTSGDNATIAGAVSLTKTIASNVASFSVTAPMAAIATNGSTKTDCG